MAIINANGTPPVSIGSVATYNFGDASGEGASNITVFDIRSTSFVGSITVVGRAQGSSNAFIAIPYTSNYLNGSVSTGLPLSTAVTDASIVRVDSTGLDVGLDCTAFTSGSASVYATRAAG